MCMLILHSLLVKLVYDYIQLPMCIPATLEVSYWTVVMTVHAVSAAGWWLLKPSMFYSGASL